MPSKRDYYEVLGVSRDAGDEEIKRAFRKLALENHPDRNVGDAEAEVRFKEATEAYEVLIDEDKRRVYDRCGHAGLERGGAPSGGRGSPLDDLFGGIFGDLFGMGGGGGGRGRPRGGRDLQFPLEIELVEAARGTKRTITISREENCPECDGSGARKGTRPVLCGRCRGEGVVVLSQGFIRFQQPCPSCSGQGSVVRDPCPRCRGQGRVVVSRTLEVNLPAGMATGNRVRLSGEGEAGDPGGRRGDLYVQVRVKDHPLFQRDGPHLVCRVPVTFSQAALGAEIEVPTLDGPVKHSLARGTQGGDVIRLAGRGLPSLRPDGRQGRRGDLLVQVVVETPRNLTRRQEELLRELAEIEHKNVSPQRKGFFEKVKDLFAAADAVEPAPTAAAADSEGGEAQV